VATEPFGMTFSSYGLSAVSTVPEFWPKFFTLFKNL
jgi:hypothetical protein